MQYFIVKKTYIIIYVGTVPIQFDVTDARKPLGPFSFTLLFVRLLLRQRQENVQNLDSAF
eukprot:833239-Amphidinium_carterae.1